MFSGAILPVAALATLSGCAASVSPQDAEGGPTFIQMPVTQQGLLGATPQLLSAAFGKPALLRVEGPAQVWLYHGAGCGLNLVLYPDTAGTPRVALAAPTADGGDAASCSAALARDHVAGAVQPMADQIAAPPAATPVALPSPSPAAPSAAADGLEPPSSS
jgi:hypothetical protein